MSRVTTSRRVSRCAIGPSWAAPTLTDLLMGSLHGSDDGRLKLPILARSSNEFNPSASDPPAFDEAPPRDVPEQPAQSSRVSAGSTKTRDRCGIRAFPKGGAGR